MEKSNPVRYNFRIKDDDGLGIADVLDALHRAGFETEVAGVREGCTYRIRDWALMQKGDTRDVGNIGVDSSGKVTLDVYGNPGLDKFARNYKPAGTDSPAPARSILNDINY